MKKTLYFLIGAIILIAVAGVLKFNFSDKDVYVKDEVSDYKNATYFIGDEKTPTTLVNGSSEKDIPDSASKISTKYFGNEVVSDFNNDGLGDVAFLLSQNSGGSGTFYYLAVALGTPNGFYGTNAILLGDRIAPQTTEFKNGMIIVNYADRNPGEPFTIKPSLGVSRYFKIIDNKLQEVKNDTLISSVEKCQLNKGTWSAEFKECLGVDKQVCESMGGKFNECASACRNDPKAQVCTLQCVLVCEFK
jgi:hypothetical protein